MDVVVIGSGSWGSAFARHLSRRDHRVTVVTQTVAEATELAERRENRAFLPGIRLPDGIAFVVRSVKADYLRAARLDDALEVITRISALRGASLLFEQDVQREGQLLFSAQVLVACIDQRRQKPTPIPTQLYSLFESLA